MPNNHVNGTDPYRMTASEAEKEIDNWVNNGGQMRIDGPHQGNDEVHAHLYLDNNPSTDILIQIDPDPNPNPNPDPDPDPDPDEDSDDDSDEDSDDDSDDD